MQKLKAAITQDKLDALLNDAKKLYDQNPKVNFPMNLDYDELVQFLTCTTVVTPDPTLCVHCNSEYAHSEILLSECAECLGLVCTFCRVDFCQNMPGEASVKPEFHCRHHGHTAATCPQNQVLCHHCEKQRNRDETRPCSECNQPLCEYCSERYYSLGLQI